MNSIVNDFCANYHFQCMCVRLACISIATLQGYQCNGCAVQDGSGKYARGNKTAVPLDPIAILLATLTRVNANSNIQLRESKIVIMVISC